MGTRWARALLLSAASIATGVALVVVAAVAEPAGAALSQADLVILPGAAPPNVQVGKPFQIDFAIKNVGVADAPSTRIDIELAFGNGPALHPVSPPIGCITLASGGPFPQTSMQCPMGPIKAGQTVGKAFFFTSSDQGTFTHGVYAVLNGASDPHPHDNDGTYTVTVGPATGPGGGGALLGALQAIVTGLFAFLHL